MCLTNKDFENKVVCYIIFFKTDDLETIYKLSNNGFKL